MKKASAITRCVLDVDLHVSSRGETSEEKCCNAKQKKTDLEKLCSAVILVAQRHKQGNCIIACVIKMMISDGLSNCLGMFFDGDGEKVG